MTQSGQGEEPSARPAREGIVLPSDGGEPLLPGMTGDYGRPTSVPASPPPAPQPSAPPGGQEWGTPWGPDRHSAPPAAQGQPWGAQGGQPWGEPEQQYPAPQQAQWGGAADTAAPQQQGGYGAGPQTASYGHGDPAGAPAPAPQQPYGGAPLPPAGHGAYPPQGYGAPMPPADEGATQFIPPVTGPPAGPDEQATRYIPPVPAAPVDEAATQFIPPVGPGALPPEVAGESTQVLGRARQQPGAGPMPPASGGDAAATQFLPPVTDRAAGAPGTGERRPLSDFDNLFRGGPGGAAPAPATQHLPRVQDPRPQQGARGGAHVPPGPRGARGAGPGRGGRGGGRTRSRVPLIAAVGVGIVALGIGAGALLAGGGEDGPKADDSKPVSASAPAGEDASPSPTADPAEQQAVALDKLLADSGDSRSTVIKAVAAVKTCGNLGQAGQDLRDAARQRNQLVTDLAKLKVDLLPGNAALTAALNKAWQASAAADNHYAAWADQVAGNKKLCKKGQARATSRTQAGNRESGTASQQKQTAAQLWNTIAKQYGLTQRQPVQL